MHGVKDFIHAIILTRIIKTKNKKKKKTNHTQDNNKNTTKRSDKRIEEKTRE